MAMRPDTQQCTGSSTADLPFRQPVVFGEDMVTGCVLYYSPADLGSNCAAIQTLVSGIQTGAQNNLLTHIGKFGNSSNLHISEWIPIIANIVPV
jgi:hypothetical protein